MKQKVFYMFMAVVFAIFAVVSIGGCGSPSSLTQDSGGENETEIKSSDNLDMANALDSDDVVDAIVERLIDTPLILEALAEAKIYNLEISGDGQIWATDISFYDEEEEEVPETADVPVLYDKYEFWRHYESGDIIILEEADIDFINTIRADVGQNSEDVSITGEAESLEVYALAKRSSLEGKVNVYSYAVPRMDSITAQSRGEGAPLREEDSTDTYDGDEEITEPVNSTPAKTYSNVDFVVDKWVDFFMWMAAVSLVTEPAEYAVEAAEVKNLTGISDTQKQTFDFSYNDLDADGIIFDGKDSSAMKFKRARTNKLEFDISSAHSFKDKKDYYFVRAKASTTPKNFNDTVVKPWGSDSYKFNYVYGYTNSLRFAAQLDDDLLPEEEWLSLEAERPAADILEDGSDTTGSLTYTVEGPVGVLERRAERIAQDGIMYSDSNTWKPEGYILVNNKEEGSVGWHADVKRPVRGSVIRSSNEPPSWYYEAAANDASKNPLEYTASWVWAVSDDFWRVHPAMKMNVQFEVVDGATSGQSYYNSKSYPQSDTFFRSTNNASFVLTQPPHTVIQADYVPFTKEAKGAAYVGFTNLILSLSGKATNSHIIIRDEAGTETIRIFAEDDWTITARDIVKTEPNWLKVSPESGSATGPEGTEVRLEYGDNPFADKNQTRVAMVEVHSGNDNVRLCVSQINQYYERYSPNIP